MKKRHVFYCSWLWAGRPGDRGSIPGRGKRIFPVASVSRPALGPTQPLVQRVPRSPFPRAKAQPRHDADHSTPNLENQRTHVAHCYAFTAMIDSP
jgi:hypothetical protein